MEQKTILQEMLEQSSVGKKNKLRIESAYRLSAKGKYEEAAEIFDELSVRTRTIKRRCRVKS